MRMEVELGHPSDLPNTHNAKAIIASSITYVVGLEGVHEDERDVDAVEAVEVLHLAHRHVQERHLLPHLDGRLGQVAAHGRAQPAVQLHDHQLVQQLVPQALR